MDNVDLRKSPNAGTAGGRERRTPIVTPKAHEKSLNNAEGADTPPVPAPPR